MCAGRVSFRVIILIAWSDQQFALCFFHSIGDILMILRLARNAVDPVRHVWEVQPNACPVKVLCFWRTGNVNLLVQRSILPLKESANTAPKCVRNVFTMKYAKV